MQAPQFTTDETLPEVPPITASVLANDLDNCINDMINAFVTINTATQKLAEVYNDLRLIRNQLDPNQADNNN